MSSKSKATGSAVTAPKGRATAARGASTGRSSRVSPTMEWLIALVVVVAVIAAIIWIWGDVRSPLGGHSGLGPDVAPVEPAELIVTPLAG
ncbi:MAG: hypothetical protein AAGG08_02630 [Actinomycetota bacterium]